MPKQMSRYATVSATVIELRRILLMKLFNDTLMGACVGLKKRSKSKIYAPNVQDNARHSVLEPNFRLPQASV